VCHPALSNDIYFVAFNDVELLRKAFQENKNEIAAVILEPIPANAGFILAKEKFLICLA